MREKIQAWLDSKGRDFAKGLALFQQASKNRSVYLYLLRKQSKDKLVYELEKLLKNMPKAVKAIKAVKEPAMDSEPDVKTIQLTPEYSGRVNREFLTDDLKQVFDDISEKYKQQRAYHERMKLEEVNDSIRAEAREMVVKLDDEITAGWEKIDAYLAEKQKEAKDPEQTGDITSDNKTKEETKDPLQIGKEVNAARKFISTNIDKVASSEGTVKETLLTKLLERYTTLINLKAEVDPETVDKLIKAGVISKT